MKILCFSISYGRPYFIYNNINNILNQSYKDFSYSVKINIDDDSEIAFYQKLLKDFENDARLKIIYGANNSQQSNYIESIESLYDDHDVFIKIDDDDIYHKNYIASMIDIFSSSSIDILSCLSDIHINNTKIYGKLGSIGQWRGDRNQETQFGMPPTYIFNKKAYSLIKEITDDQIRKIHLFEDAAWRTVWRQNGLKSLIIDQENLFTYNIHGKNISSKFMFDPNQDNENFLENEYFAIYKMFHKDWSSYVYFNKRNNRVYNINNNDHGEYKNINEKIIEIKWDNWGAEKFKKNLNKNFYKHYAN